MALITNVLGKGFKGRDFDVKLGPKTLILGDNGTGKSAIVQALELALEGQVSGGVHKTNQAIFDAFATMEKMTVEARVTTSNGNGKTIPIDLLRQLSRAQTGSVTQTFMVDRKKADYRTFSHAAGLAGAPRIFNVETFVSLPADRMISYLAEKFGTGNLDAAGTSAEAVKKKINALQAKVKENETYISRNQQGIANLNLPAGSLAEVQIEITRTEAEKKMAEDNLRKEERRLEKERKAEADKAAKLKADAEAAAAKLKADAEAANNVVKGGPANTATAGYPPLQQGKQLPWEDEHKATTPLSGSSPGNLRTDPVVQNPIVETQYRGVVPSAAASVQRILTAIEAVQCPACKGGFAYMVAKNELKKHGGR